MAETYKPTGAMASNARRAKKMRDAQPPSRKGMTPVGLARMNQLINRTPLSLSTVKRMYSFFSRHEVDKQSKEWKKGNSRAEQGWLGWGGDAGYRWSKAIVERESAKDVLTVVSQDENIPLMGDKLSHVWLRKKLNSNNTPQHTKSLIREVLKY